MNKRKMAVSSLLFWIVIGLAVGTIDRRLDTEKKLKELSELHAQEQIQHENRLKSLETMIVNLETKLDAVKKDEPPPKKEIVYKPEVIKARVTAYAPLDNKSGICAEGNPRVTATGTRSRRGVVAVDPNKIPYGSRLFIPGYGEAVAEDTGGALRRYDGIAIDILVDSYSEAMKWGKQYMDIVILERGDNGE